MNDFQHLNVYLKVSSFLCVSSCHITKYKSPILNRIMCHWHSSSPILLHNRPFCRIQRLPLPTNVYTDNGRTFERVSSCFLSALRMTSTKCLKIFLVAARWVLFFFLYIATVKINKDKYILSTHVYWKENYLPSSKYSVKIFYHKHRTFSSLPDWVAFELPVILNVYLVLLTLAKYQLYKQRELKLA